MEKAKVPTFSIAVFIRVHKVIGLPFLLLLPEVRHHVPLQLLLELPIDSRARLYLLLRTVGSRAFSHKRPDPVRCSVTHVYIASLEVV